MLWTRGQNNRVLLSLGKPERTNPVSRAVRRWATRHVTCVTTCEPCVCAFHVVANLHMRTPVCLHSSVCFVLWGLLHPWPSPCLCSFRCWLCFWWRTRTHSLICWPPVCCAFICCMLISHLSDAGLSGVWWTYHAASLTACSQIILLLWLPAVVFFFYFLFVLIKVNDHTHRVQKQEQVICALSFSK